MNIRVSCITLSDSVRVWGSAGSPSAQRSPGYVVGKDLNRNVLVVAQGNDHAALFASELTASDLFWINGKTPQGPLRCAAKIRYRQADQACCVDAIEGGYRIRFDSPQRAVTPGQSVVLYDGERCLGGGVIEGVA